MYVASRNAISCRSLTIIINRYKYTIHRLSVHKFDISFSLKYICAYHSFYLIPNPRQFQNFDLIIYSHDAERKYIHKIVFETTQI